MGSRLKIAVLGCGPTGLLAAHGAATAANDLGRSVEIVILSSKRKSPLYGCQYLHEKIPGLKLPRQTVHYQLLGDMEVYRKKVYGQDEDVEVSPALLDQKHLAWDIRAAYDQLWDVYEDAIYDYLIPSGGEWLGLKARLNADGFSIISSIPSPVLCVGSACKFSSATVWAMGDAWDLGRPAALPHVLREGNVLCSGRTSDPWYRASKVFRHGTVEWPEDYAGVPRGASRVKKPLWTNCPCNPSVLRVGRYGRWEKGVLSHEAFHDGYEFVKNR